MTEREERVLGIRIAKKEGLEETARAIKDNQCYRVIFNTLVREAGKGRSLELIRKAKDPYWAYWFAWDVSGISEDTREKLRAVTG